MLPRLTDAVRRALASSIDYKWTVRATTWLSGSDRTSEAARAAAYHAKERCVGNLTRAVAAWEYRRECSDFMTFQKAYWSSHPPDSPGGKALLAYLFQLWTWGDERAKEELKRWGDWVGLRAVEYTPAGTGDLPPARPPS